MGKIDYPFSGTPWPNQVEKIQIYLGSKGGNSVLTEIIPLLKKIIFVLYLIIHIQTLLCNIIKK